MPYADPAKQREAKRLSAARRYREDAELRQKKVDAAKERREGLTGRALEHEREQHRQYMVTWRAGKAAARPRTAREYAVTLKFTREENITAQEIADDLWKLREREGPDITERGMTLGELIAAWDAIILGDSPPGE